MQLLLQSFHVAPSSIDFGIYDLSWKANAKKLDFSLKWNGMEWLLAASKAYKSSRCSKNTCCVADGIAVKTCLKLLLLFDII